jgi:acyl dehydratase
MRSNRGLVRSGPFELVALPLAVNDLGGARDARSGADDAGWELAMIRHYDGGLHEVHRAHFAAYALATNDVNPAYQGEDSVAPPMFHVRLLIRLMEAMAADPQLDLDRARLVHGEHEMTFHRVLRDGDVVAVRGSLEKIEEKSNGSRVAAFRLEGLVDGEVVLEGRTVYFVRGVSSGVGKKGARTAPEPLPSPTFERRSVVDEDQTYRYAEASGDHNRIHVDPAFATSVGLPSIIVHGLCTMAFAQRDIIDRFCGGDPARLSRIGLRWARPVLPGDSLTLKVWDDGDGELRFVTENGAGKTVLANGRATVRPER